MRKLLSLVLLGLACVTANAGQVAPQQQQLEACDGHKDASAPDKPRDGSGDA